MTTMTRPLVHAAAFVFVVLHGCSVHGVGANTSIHETEAVPPGARRCYDSAKSLQEAINAVPPQNQNKVELLLCAGTELQLSQPLQIRDRSIRLGCAHAGATVALSSSTTTTACTLKASDEQARETRLIEVTATSTSVLESRSRVTAVTVELSQLQLENGESYSNRGGGGAVHVEAANLIVEDCRFVNNVASEHGGAISVQDRGKPILFLVTRSIFRENLSIHQDDCHSIFFHQDHPASLAELNTELDFLPNEAQATTTHRQLLEHWDDPAKAAHAIDRYRPKPGTVLCF